MTALTLPTLPRILRATPRLMQFNQRLQPPLGGPEQRIQRMGSRWAMELEFDALNDADAKTVRASLLKAQSLGYSVSLPVPQPTQTSVAGTPLVNGGSQTGSSLITDGWTAAVNKLTYSEDLSNAAWTTTEATISTNASKDANGETLLDRVIPSTSNTTHYVGRTITMASGDSLAISGVARAGGYPGLKVLVGSADGVNGFEVAFNLSGGGAVASSGTIGTGGTFTSASISQVSGYPGLYAFTAVGKVPTGQTSAALRFLAGSTPSTFSFAGDTSRGVDLGMLQYEIAGAATAYKKAGSAQICAEAGRWLSVTVSSRQYLYMLTDDAVVNSSGQSTLSIAPMLRASPADNAAIEINAPNIEGFLDDESAAWLLEMKAWSTFRLGIAEVA